MSLKQQTFNSALLLSSSGLLRKLINFATTIVLARILEPAIFGMYALAFVVIDGFGLFKSFGIDTALIQKKEKDNEAADTAFMIIPLFGFVLYVILYFVAPFLSNSLDQEAMVPVIRALGLIFVLNAIQRVPLVLYEKQMRFGFLALTGPLMDVVFAVFAIMFSLQGMGIWSLVWAFLIKNIVSLVVVFYYSGFRPKFKFNREIATDLFHFGKFVFISSILWFVVQSFDKIVIPKIIDIATLGLYSIAFNFSTLVSSYVGSRVNRVLYPAYSKLQNNQHDFKVAYLKVAKLLVALSLPISVGIFLLGGDFLRLAYGEKWVGAIPILQILCWLGLFNTIGATNGGALLALKKPKVITIVDSIKAVMVFALLIPAGKIYGVNGIASVVVGTTIIAFIIRTGYLKKVLNLSGAKLIKTVQTSILSVLVMSVVIIIVQSITNLFNVHIAIRFLIATILASASYLVLFYMLEKDFVHEVRGLVFKGKKHKVKIVPTS